MAMAPAQNTIKGASGMGKAPPAKKVSVAELVDFGGFDPKLGMQIKQLQADAIVAELDIERSYWSLYEVLARCLALTATYTKEHPAFKMPLKDKKGNLECEYPTSTQGRPSSPFRSVVWQVFRNPPAQTVYRYTSVLSLVEFAAEKQGVNPTNTKTTVAFMKQFGRLDAMVDKWKEVKAAAATGGTTNGFNGTIARGDGTTNTNGQAASTEERSEQAISQLITRPTLVEIPAAKLPSYHGSKLVLLAGLWSDDGKFGVRPLDTIAYPTDAFVLEAWKAELRQRQANIQADPNTQFLRDICVLSKAIRERKRPKGDQSILTHYQRRITLQTSGNSLRADIGLVGTSEGVTLEGVLSEASWMIRTPAAVYRTSAENHEEVIEKNTRGDLRRRDRDAVLDVGTGNKSEKAIGVTAKLKLRSDTGQSATAYLVRSSTLESTQMQLKPCRWDYETTLTFDEVSEAIASIEALSKFEGVDNNGRSRKLGFAFILKCGSRGLKSADHDGEQEGKLARAKGKLKGKGFTLFFRTDDWIAAMRTIAKSHGAEEVFLRIKRGGLAQLEMKRSFASYRLNIPSCDEEGARETKFVARSGERKSS